MSTSTFHKYCNSTTPLQENVVRALTLRHTHALTVTLIPNSSGAYGNACFALTVACVFGAGAGAVAGVGQFQQRAIETFDGTVHPCDGTQLLLVL